MRCNSPQPARQLRRRDDHQLRRRPGQADVEQLVQAGAEVGSSTRITTSRSIPLKRRIVSNRTSSGSSGTSSGARPFELPSSWSAAFSRERVAEAAVAPDLAGGGRGAREHGDPERRDLLLLDQPMEGLAQRLEGGGPGFGADDRVPPFGRRGARWSPRRRGRSGRRAARSSPGCGGSRTARGIRGRGRRRRRSG